MKNILLMIETGGPGGAETVVLKLAKHLDRTRFHPTIVVPKSGWLHSQLCQAGVDALVIPSHRSWDIGFVIRLIRLIRARHVDLVHSHLPGANLYACVAGLLTGTPVVTTYHGELVLPGTVERHASLKYLLLRKLATRIVLVADYLRHDYVKTARFPENKLFTIYNGVELDDYGGSFKETSEQPAVNISPGDLVVGIVANFRAAKGYEFFLEAAVQVLKQLPQVTFLIIGEGEGTIRTSVERFIAEHQIQSKITLLGFRPDVPQLLRCMDLFVLSSVSEGLPLAVVEAMAAARPVVATRVGGLSELVVDGQTGFLVPPGDPVGLAEKMLMLLRNAELRQTFGRRGRAVAASAFSVDKMVDSYQHLYERVTTR